MRTTDQPFHQQLQQLRKSRDLTQAIFARRVGCAVSTIRKIEQGTLRPSRDLAVHLAHALNLPETEIEQFVRAARGVGVVDSQSAPMDELAQSSDIRAIVAIPTPLTPFIGREDEVAYLVGQLEDPTVRLLTLTGPSGVGKTRLAIRAGMELYRLNEQDVLSMLFVPLAALNDPKLVINAIVQTLRPQGGDGRSAWRYLLDTFRTQPAILILDNFEHLLDAAHEMTALLLSCPSLRVLATSRVRLGIYGEHVYPVAPLPLPKLYAANDLRAVTGNPACAMFLQRARAANPTFDLTLQNAPAVIEICQRLDGLPLALELAAARIRLLSPAALLARLSHPLELLTAGIPAAERRQQTLRSAIDWSYQLLDTRRQLLFCRLSVFTGDYDVQAIEAVCCDARVSAETLLDDLDLLVSSSLVQRVSDASSEPRFATLEVLREYAWEQLIAEKAGEELQRKHATYFREFAEQAEQELLGADQVRWLDRLEREHGNLRTALHWACTQGMAEITLAMVGALARFWWLHGHLSEGRRWLQLALTLHDGAPLALRAKALYWSGILSIHQGDYLLAHTALADGLTLYQTLQEPQGVGLVLNALGVVANRENDHALAQSHYEESLRIARASGNIERVATSLNNLGYTLLLRRLVRQARACLRESLTLARNLEDTQGQAFALTNLGMVALAQDRPCRARPFFQASLRLFRSLGDLRNSAEALEGLAEVALVRKDAATAVQFLGTANSYRLEIGAPLAAHTRVHIEQLIETARIQLGESAFEEAWRAGQQQAKNHQVQG